MTTNRWSYEDAMKDRYYKTGLGMRVVLEKGPPFWSVGWSGCSRCHGDVTHHTKLEYFERRDGPEVTVGWRCA